MDVIISFCRLTIMVTFLLGLVPAHGKHSCVDLFVPLKEIPNGIHLDREQFFSQFLESRLRRIALLKIAKEGNFHGRLYSFVNDSLENDVDQVLSLEDGTQIRITVTKLEPAYEGAESDEAILLDAGALKVYLVLKDPNRKEVEVLTYKKGLFASSLKYQGLTRFESQQRDDLKSRIFETPEALTWLMNKMNGMSEEDNPKPASLVGADRADQVPLNVYSDINKEAADRITWPSLNSGGSIEGFLFVAKALNALFDDNSDLTRLNSIQDEFNREYKAYLQSYLIGIQALEKIQYAYRSINGNNTLYRDSIHAKVLYPDELESRAQDLALQSDYFDGFRAGKGLFDGLENKPHFTLRLGHYLHIYDIESLELGRISVKILDLQRNRVQRYFSLSFDQFGRLSGLDDGDHYSYITTQIYLQEIAHLEVL